MPTDEELRTLIIAATTSTMPTEEMRTQGRKEIVEEIRKWQRQPRPKHAEHEHPLYLQEQYRTPQQKDQIAAQNRDQDPSLKQRPN